MNDAYRDVLNCVHETGLLGITSVEIAAKLGLTLNRTTAILSGLHDDHCVARVKEPGDSGRPVFRYTYKQERVNHPRGKNPRSHKHSHMRMPDVLLTLPLGPKDSVTCTLDHARGLYKHLASLFGEK